MCLLNTFLSFLQLTYLYALLYKPGQRGHMALLIYFGPCYVEKTDVQDHWSYPHTTNNSNTFDDINNIKHEIYKGGA